MKGRLTAITRASRQSKKKVATSTVPGMTIAETRLGSTTVARCERMSTSLDTAAATSPAVRARNQPSGRAETLRPIFEIRVPQTSMTLTRMATTMLTQFTRKAAAPRPIRTHNHDRADAGFGPRKARRKGIRTTKARPCSSAETA